MTDAEIKRYVEQKLESMRKKILLEIKKALRQK